MTRVEIHGKDPGDFRNGKLFASALSALNIAKKTPPAIVDLSVVEFLHPYATAAIAAIGSLAPTKPKLIVPRTQEARDYVLRSGLAAFFELDEPGELSPSPRSVSVRQLTKLDASFADEITTAWDSEFKGMPAGLRLTFADHLDEMIRNALGHAKSRVGCFVAAQVYPSKSSVEVSILDVGQTIRKHLKANPQNRAIDTDARAILEATKEGVTGTPPGQINDLGEPNSGVGLFELRKYCESGGGELAVLSGNRIVVFALGTTPLEQPYRARFPGCLINIKFNV